MYFADGQLRVGATPTLSFISIAALKGWVSPSSLDSLQQGQHASPLICICRVEMEHQMESQKRRGLSKDDLICKIFHIPFPVFSSQILYWATVWVKVLTNTGLQLRQRLTKSLFILS